MPSTVQHRGSLSIPPSQARTVELSGAVTCDDITLRRATETVSVSTCLRVHPLTWQTLVVMTDETKDSVGLSIVSKGVRGKSLRTNVLWTVTTPSCVTSQGEERSEGPVWGLK